jgi:PiT family inorganic phosphate transporter
MTLVLLVVLVALIFEYINGFHDTANSIATVVSTKVLTPRMAIGLAAITNLVGALVGVAVAKTIASGLVEAKFVSSATIVCALFGGIVWNLLTWWFGLPSSSSHALVGGLVGATVASAGAILPPDVSPWSAVIWEQVKAGAPLKDQGGLLYKVIIPMVLSPMLGLIVGFLVMSLLYIVLRNWRPMTVSSTFGKLQVFSAGFMGFSHGQADAQKTMGIIALALMGATSAGVLSDLPWMFSFLRIEDMGPKNDHIPLWIKFTCALTMCAGTAAGGWKIIKTMGHKMVKMQPVHGFAAETTAATVLVTAASFGMPVSTTHAITTSIMGVGCAKRWSALNLPVVFRIVIAWILTIPATLAIGWLTMKLWLAAGWAVT